MISFADLHCDTMYECAQKQRTLDDHKLHIHTDAIQKFDRFLQVFAHYIPENTENKWDFLQKNIHYSLDQINTFQTISGFTPVLSVEGGDVFDNLIYAEKQIELLKQQGICFFSMIYNHTCSLGCGALSETDSGLTDKGFEILEMLEHQEIVLDVSHASVRSTDNILSKCKNPVVATHSNSFTLTPHARNLRDEHIRQIAESGGLIGINLYPPFLSEKGSADFTDIERHISYMLDHAGEEHVAFGCDFDGVDDLPKGIRDVSSMENLFCHLRSRGFRTDTLDKIFYKNIIRFLNDTGR